MHRSWASWGINTWTKYKPLPCFRAVTWQQGRGRSQNQSRAVKISGELHCQMQICSVRLMSTSATVSWGNSLPLAHASFTEVCTAKLNSTACDFLEDVHLPWTAWAAPGPHWQLHWRNCPAWAALPSSSTCRNSSPLVLGVKGTMLACYTLICFYA